jgi:hypothetical protein
MTDDVVAVTVYLPRNVVEALDRFAVAVEIPRRSRSMSARLLLEASLPMVDRMSDIAEYGKSAPQKIAEALQEAAIDLERLQRETLARVDEIPPVRNLSKGRKRSPRPVTRGPLNG